jgi:hypothetical protein
MNNLRVLLVAAALLTAACGTATISGSQVKSVSSSGNVRVDAGASAGTDVAVGAEDDLSRPNPTVRKGGPVPVHQSQPPTPAATEPSTSGHDRCTDGIGANPAFGPRGSAGGKHPPLPECAVE